MDNNSAIKREQPRQKRESARCLYKALEARCCVLCVREQTITHSLTLSHSCT